MAIFVCLFLSFSCVFVCVHWNYSSNNQHQQQIPPQHTAPTSPRDESQQQQQNENTHRNLPSPAAAHPQPANANQDMDEDVAINQVCTLRIVNDRTNESENCKNLWNEWTIYFCFFAIKFIAFNSYIEKKELDVRWIELFFFSFFLFCVRFHFYFHFDSGEFFASAASDAKCYTKRPTTATTIKSAIFTRTKYRYVRRTAKSTE